MLITDRASEICYLDADKILVLPEGGVADMTKIRDLFCNANFTVFLKELSSEFDVSGIINLVSTVIVSVLASLGIWYSVSLSKIMDSEGIR